MILESVKLKKNGNTDQSPAFENVKKREFVGTG